MRVFCASVATETNTFSPMRTDLVDFHESFYAPPGKHPKTPTLCSAVFVVLRERTKIGGMELIEGTATWAEPGGLINRNTWNSLCGEVLEQVKEAMPLDAVVLGLHGAMISENCVDCEGELLESVRGIVGDKTTIGVTFDPHSHLSDRRVENADIITVFKEFPHSDFVETAKNCVDLTLKSVAKEIKPQMTVYDVKMIDIFPTSKDPMRGFVDRIRSMEGHDKILSISVIHGFMAGDSPDLGTKILVISDDDAKSGYKLASQLGEEIYSFKGNTHQPFLSAEEALTTALKHPKQPVVIADAWNNPGGGVPGDSTVFTRLVLDRGLENLAIGTIWDPCAVRNCNAAGEGAIMNLRFGGKTSNLDGEPIDAEVEVIKTVRNAVQSFGDSIVPLGDSVAIRIGGVEVVLNSVRSQTFSPSLFSNMGIDPTRKKVLIVTSTNHFYHEFSKIAGEILYADVPGSYPRDPRKTDYTQLKRKIWPIN